VGTLIKPAKKSATAFREITFLTKFTFSSDPQSKIFVVGSIFETSPLLKITKVISRGVCERVFGKLR
jgi:hypothetical protein